MMANRKDVETAKDFLSARLLRRKVAGREIATTPARTIAAARENASHNVHGVGVARKIVAGKQTKTLCVRLYVTQKLPESVIPIAARLPKEINGVPTDVVEAPRLRFHNRKVKLPRFVDCSTDRRKRQRPVVGGISAAHYAVNITTLGCFCSSTRPNEAGRQFMLSCNHAFANMNAGKPGDRILQPSPGDNGGSSPDGDVVGNLARFVPLQLDGSTPNVVDAAIAEVSPGLNVNDLICTIGPLAGICAPSAGMTVCKHGRSSGYTEGIVDDVNFDFEMEYTPTQFIHVTNQLLITTSAGYQAFGTDGDSGSIVVDKKSNRAVGLYIGGSGIDFLANHIDKVCEALEISIP